MDRRSGRWVRAMCRIFGLVDASSDEGLEFKAQALFKVRFGVKGLRFSFACLLQV